MSQHAPWFVAGPMLGVIVVGLLWIANKPLGALGGYVDVADRLTKKGTALGWRSFFLLGVVAGGFVFAVSTTGPALSFGYGHIAELAGTSMVAQAAVLFVAGGLIGFGARMAGGCTSGHGICGISHGRFSSIAATMTFMATAVLARHAIEIVAGGAP